MNNTSPDFTEKTKRILAKMASERCCLCEEITSMPNPSESNFIRIGEAAHISGARKSFTVRFNEKLTNEERKNIKNGIWLCSNCHTIIDQDENHYTIPELEKIRSEHYQRILNGKYSKSSFRKIDELNNEVKKLNTIIEDKKFLILQSKTIFDAEITGLKMQIQQINLEKRKLWEDYNSILQNLEQADNFEEVYKMVFEENNLQKALEYLSDENLEKDALRLAKKYLLKADIYKLQSKNEAIHYYRKAYATHPSVKVAHFYIRYLNDVRNFKSLIEFILELLETELKIEDRIALNGQLGTIYSKIDPHSAVMHYKAALSLIDKKIKSDQHYYVLKAGFLNYLAASYKNNNKLQEALQTCQESLKIFLSEKIPAGDNNFFYELASLYNTIARIYIIDQNYSEAEKYLDLAVKIATEKINDDGELLATIYLNYCNIFEIVPNNSWKKFEDIINLTVSIFSKLFEKNPLQFIEKLIASTCRKADISFTLQKFEEFHVQLDHAENILKQFIAIDQTGFEFLLTEIHMRRTAFFIYSKNLKLANVEADKALSYFEKIEFNDVDTVSKYAHLAMLKCNLVNNSEQKKKLLLETKKRLQPFSSTMTSLTKIYIDITDELAKL